MRRFLSSIKRAVLQLPPPVKTLRDEYLDWLGFANAGMMHPGNLYCLDYAIANLPSNNPVLEIGSFCGLSTNAMAHFLRKQKRPNKIVCSDKWIFENSDKQFLGTSSIQHADYRDYVKSSFMRNVEFFSPDNKPYAIEMFSDEFFSCYESGKEMIDIYGRNLPKSNFSFAYIDGNHTYDFARRDFINTDKFLDVGGFVLFDDSSDTNPFGLTKLMREVCQMPRYALIEKNPNYLFKKLG